MVMAGEAAEAIGAASAVMHRQWATPQAHPRAGQPLISCLANDQELAFTEASATVSAPFPQWPKPDPVSDQGCPAGPSAPASPP